MVELTSSTSASGPHNLRGHTSTEPLPEIGTIQNTGINTVPYDSKPATLSDKDTVALSMGPRFIPASYRVLTHAEVDFAFKLLEHRLALAVKYSDPPPPRFVGTTLVPYKRRPTGHFEALDQGSLRAAVYHWRTKFHDQSNKELNGSERIPKVPPRNIPSAVFHTLGTWKNKTEWVLRPADKNLGPTLMSKEYYVRCCLTHLEDASTYADKGKASTDRLKAVYIDTLLEMLSTILLRNGRLTKAEVESLIGPHEGYRVPRFYCIPKLHKLSEAKPHEARPIVSQSGAPTEVASKMLSTLLNTIIGPQHWWALKDTPSVINQLADLTLPTGTANGSEDPNGEKPQVWLLTMDVTALYPNMDIPTAITDVVEAVENHLQQLESNESCDTDNSDQHRIKQGASRCTPDPSETIALVQELLEYVLHNTYFTFDAGDGKGKKLYQQIAGAPMGSAAIPPIANIYMAARVKNVVNKWMQGSSDGQPGPLRFAKGFIDDILMVLYGTHSDTHRLKDEIERQDPTGKLRLTMTLSTSEVPFLDLWIRYTATSRLTGRLEVAPYAKALNKYLYIPPWSGHTPRSLSSFISGEAKRLIRNSSHEDDATFACTQLVCHLMARGYSVELVLRELAKVSYARRQMYLAPKATKPEGTLIIPKPKVVALTLTYQPYTRALPTRQLIRDIQQAIPYHTTNPTRVVVGWRNDSNLQSLLRLQWPKVSQVEML